MDDYEDIIDTKWPVDNGRIRMPVAERAKIFGSFAALKGFEEKIEKMKKTTSESMNDMVT